MSFFQIDDDIKNGVLDRAAPVLLFGEERFLVNFYERQLTSSFTHGERGLDVSVFYGNEAGDDAVVAALETFPMLSPVRVVIVRGHLGFSSPSGGADDENAGTATKSPKDKYGLADCLGRMPDTSRLIFSSENVNRTRALFKAVSKYGSVYEFKRLNEAGLLQFSRKRFKTFGAEIPSDVLDAFNLATGYLEKDSERDLFTVENAAYKIASFVLAEGRTAITHSDIEECLEDTPRTDVFAMLDAISSGRKGEAIKLLENSIASGDNVFRLLALFTGHFEIMLGFKELSAEGRSTMEITQILGERSDWRVRKLGGFAERFETEKLMWILGRLYETEKLIKSGDIADRLALTVLLAQI